MQQKIVLGVIGSPISHSLSPHLHAFLIDKLGLDCYYHAFEVQPENLRAAIDGTKALGIRGLNVTVPHKQNVMAYLDSIDEAAAKIGAVNTIRFENGRAFGANTDAPGFLKNLQFQGVELHGREVFVLGAGGAARAVVYAAKQAGAAAIKICNRTPERAQQLAGDFGAQAVTLREIQALAAGSIAINTTSVGMYPEADASPLAEKFFRRDLIYIDLVYNPVKTRFLQYAETVGAKTVDGLGMLIFQGAIALGFWTGQEIDVEKWYDEVREKIGCKLLG
ncbi:MAG: shikimate dehydrogenase [bacterium]